MPRARNIKPGFFTNEELVELPMATRLLFIGLWTLADREGRLEDRPKRIKMNIFPADDVDVDSALSELESAGFLIRYEVNGCAYIQILNFDKHQNPHKQERPSSIPAPCEHGASTVQAPDSHSSCHADSHDSHDSRDSRDSVDTTAAKAANEYPIDFERAWRKYPRRDGGNPKKRALKAWRARIREGVDGADLEAGVDRYAAHVRAKGKEGTEFVMQAATFFGPDEHWRQEYSAEPPKQQGVAWGDHMMVDFDAREAERNANG